MTTNENPGKLTVWLLASRPKTLPAGLVPVFIGGALAFDTGVFHVPSFAVALVGALLIQIGTNFANDLCDFLKDVDDEERIGPLRVTQAGLVTPRQMKVATALVFLLAVLVGSYLVMRGGLPVVVIGVASILCGIFYTAGPRPLGYLGLGDVFVLLFFGPMAVGGTYYVVTLDINAVVLIAGLPPGMLSTAILAVNNLRDLDTDARTGKRTLAVRLGRRFARGEYIFLLVGAALLPALLGLGGGHPLAALTLLILVPAVPTMRKVLRESSGPVLNGALAETGRLMILFGVFFTIGWLS